MKLFYKDCKFWVGDISIWVGAMLFRDPPLSILNWHFWVIALFVSIGVGLLYQERYQ